MANNNNNNKKYQKHCIDLKSKNVCNELFITGK